MPRALIENSNKSSKINRAKMMTRISCTNLLAISMIIQLIPAIAEKTYVIDGQDRVTWDEAMELCQQRGMELVSVESAEENDRLRQILDPVASASPGTIKDFWTSGRLIKPNQWEWASTGQPFTFVNWVIGAPNDYLGKQKCLRLWGLHRFQWDDFFCRAKLHFICQKQPERDVDALQPRSSDGQIGPPDINTSDDYDNQSNSDFENSNIVSVRDPKDEQESLVKMVKPYEEIQKDATIQREADQESLVKMEQPYEEIQKDATIQRQPDQEPSTIESSVLRLESSSFTICSNEKLGWEEARAECNAQQMELAVIGVGEETEKIEEFLQDNGLEKNNYWIGYLHVETEDLTSKDKRAVDQPSVQLTIGVKPGQGNFMAGDVTGLCPLLQQSDGMSLTFEPCEDKNYFICEKPGPDGD